MSTTKIQIPCRFSFVNVWKPKANDDGTLKYSASLIIDKSDTKTIKKIKAAIAAAMEAGATTLKGKKGLRNPLRDGDKEREGDGAYEGAMFLNASSEQQPGIVQYSSDGDPDPITDQREFYSGCHGYASINFFAYNKKGNAGIGVGLNHVMKVKDGDPLTGRGSAESDFKDITIEDDFEEEEEPGSEFF